ncbi:MAG: DUF2336 domain-containing protein [Beijerinckiaceae bacterium]
MITRRFLEWSRHANASERAEGANALARAYLYSDLADEERGMAEAALTTLLDDNSALVRRALADAFASAADAPRSLVIALAHDQSDVAAPLLARSPLLSDADLVDCAAVGDIVLQGAIATRADLSMPVCAALAEGAGPDPLIILCGNTSAQISEASLRRMIERHGDVAALRETMLQRPDLPVSVHHMLIMAVSNTLSQFIDQCQWMRSERRMRVVSEACEAATITIAEDAVKEQSLVLVRHLRETKQLTAGLLLRALFSHRFGFVAAAIEDLSGQPAKRVTALLNDPRSAAFRALYLQSGLPESLLPAFRAALLARRACAHDAPAQLSRRMIEQTLLALEDLPEADYDKLFALLRRYETEATRAEARAFIDAMMSEPAANIEDEIRALVEAEFSVAA